MGFSSFTTLNLKPLRDTATHYNNWRQISPKGSALPLSRKTKHETLLTSTIQPCSLFVREKSPDCQTLYTNERANETIRLVNATQDIHVIFSPDSQAVQGASVTLDSLPSPPLPSNRRLRIRLARDPTRRVSYIASLVHSTPLLDLAIYFL